MSLPYFSIKRQSLAIFIVLTSLFSSLQAEEKALEKKVIAIVRDGDSEFFDNIIIEALKKHQADDEKAGDDNKPKPKTSELQILADGKYDYQLKDEFNANYQDGEPLKQLMKALADEEVDLIYTAGIVVSHLAAALPPAQRTKPIVAGAVEFSNLANKMIAETGTSNIPNYTFIMAPRRIQADLEAFKKLARSSSLHAVVDQQVIKVIGEDVEKDLALLHQRLGITLTILPATPTAAGTLANIPANAKNVYLPMLPSMTQMERARLIRGLTQRGIKTFSMIGISDIDAGAFACLSAGTGLPFFRRTAINIHQLLSGISTDLLPVVLNSSDKLSINMETAKQLGWSPDYDTTLSASLINKHVLRPSTGKLNLQQAMKMASQLNPDVIAARAAQQAAAWQTASLQTSFRPQLSIGGNIGVSGVNDRINPLTTPKHAGAASLGIEVSQLLYSDRLFSQIKSQAKVAEAAKYDLESARLDVIQSTANSYLEALNTEALWKIEKKNLLRSEHNLQLAKLRRDIGSAEASETYRWQANVAQAKALLLQRDAVRRTARIQLNVNLAVDRTKHWSLTDITLKDHQFYFMDNEIRHIVQDLNGLGKFTGYIQSLAKYRSPEIKSFDRTLRSQGILLNERARRNLRPEVSLSAGISQIVQEAHNVSRDSQNEWTVGVGFTMPLWEGGLKKTEMSRINAVIRQLQAQRQKALFLIEQKALSAAYAMSSSHPSMRLSRQAKKFSQENYDAVQNKYLQGSVNIVELLDAQNQLQTLEQSKDTATYQYIKDIIAVQRAMGWYEHEKSAAQKKEWTQWLKNYFKTGSIHVSSVSK